MFLTDSLMSFFPREGEVEEGGGEGEAGGGEGEAVILDL